MLPTPAFISAAEITETVNNPTIETYNRPPISFVENKGFATPTPVSRGPKETDLRCQHPRTRHSVIIADIVVVGPVARRPDITLTGAKRLLVDGQSRRTKRYGYADLGERSS